MGETHCVAIVSGIHGRGFVCFFDEPFGEQTPFEWAGGYLVRYDCGINDGGVILSEDLAKGIDAWLKKNHWRRVEDVEATVEV